MTVPTAELTAPHRGGSTIRRSLTSSNAAKTGHGLSRSQRRTIHNQRALAIAETAYGHPDVGAALNTLALIVGKLGDFAAARPLAEPQAGRQSLATCNWNRHFTCRQWLMSPTNTYASTDAWLRRWIRRCRSERAAHTPS